MICFRVRVWLGFARIVTSRVGLMRDAPFPPPQTKRPTRQHPAGEPRVHDAERGAEGAHPRRGALRPRHEVKNKIGERSDWVNRTRAWICITGGPFSQNQPLPTD